MVKNLYTKKWLKIIFSLKSDPKMVKNFCSEKWLKIFWGQKMFPKWSKISTKNKNWLKIYLHSKMSITPPPKPPFKRRFLFKPSWRKTQCALDFGTALTKKIKTLKPHKTFFFITVRISLTKIFPALRAGLWRGYL